MRYFLIVITLFLFGCKSSPNKSQDTVVHTKEQERPAYAIVIHGGAGNVNADRYGPDKQEEYATALNAALDIGENILKAGGTSLDAVTKTIMYMEDSPLFNAGKGAVFTSEGKNSLDASIMLGSDRDAGAVGGVTQVKNPITAAIAVMQNSPHVMLSGAGADRFALEQGLEIVNPRYFFTQKSMNSLKSAQKREESRKAKVDKHGTVGCVALDKDGNIVAGTSTGGMTNKKWDRIGDSPIIGAGTYADNKTCGVSATGHGEYFIRNTVARDIAAMMEYKGSTLQEASDYIINDVLVKAGGDGGIVALDKYGNIAMPFNTTGMFRGYSKEGERVVKMFED